MSQGVMQFFQARFLYVFVTKGVDPAHWRKIVRLSNDGFRMRCFSNGVTFGVAGSVVVDKIECEKVLAVYITQGDIKLYDASYGI